MKVGIERELVDVTDTARLILIFGKEYDQNSINVARSLRSAISRFIETVAITVLHTEALNRDYLDSVPPYYDSSNQSTSNDFERNIAIQVDFYARKARKNTNSAKSMAMKRSRNKFSNLPSTTCIPGRMLSKAAYENVVSFLFSNMDVGVSFKVGEKRHCLTRRLIKRKESSKTGRAISNMQESIMEQVDAFAAPLLSILSDEYKNMVFVPSIFLTEKGAPDQDEWQCDFGPDAFDCFTIIIPLNVDVLFHLEIDNDVPAERRQDTMVINTRSFLKFDGTVTHKFGGNRQKKNQYTMQFVCSKKKSK
jgi:hypothetical protein